MLYIQMVFGTDFMLCLRKLPGQLKTALMLSELVKDLVWPDFKVGVEGS